MDARIVAAAGGVLHERQLQWALESLPATPAGDDLSAARRLTRLDRMVRLTGPSQRERAERSASVFSRAERLAIASAVVRTAEDLCNEGSDVSPIELVYALRPVLHMAELGSLTVDAAVGC
ncbi:MAG: hypothetical protein M3P34_00905 [Actinomycetota bacterium]|nr:hypothetical protein [Actinomycetota bacterium]